MGIDSLMEPAYSWTQVSLKPLALGSLSTMEIAPKFWYQFLLSLCVTVSPRAITALRDCLLKYQMELNNSHPTF